MDTFKTITSKTEGIYKEKGSKFLSFAIPVNNTEDIKSIIKEFRKKYFDARHLCYAYMLGSEHTNYRTNDDGEPSGTAGRPILGQINSRGLTNVLVIVVRYFGGILLGTGGLITAYKEAAADSLNKADIIEKSVDIAISVNFDYINLNEVMRIIKESNVVILNQNFNNICNMEISVPKNDEFVLISRLNIIPNLKISNLL